MDKFYIYGPNKTNGEIKISGAKNSILPILFASLLIKEDIKIKNIPKIKDVKIVLKLFKKIGSKILFKKSIFINNKYINKSNITFKLIKKIRASIWFLSPIIIRLGKIKIYKPGGCNIGKRPIDLHIYVLKCLGIIIKTKQKIISGHIKKLQNNIIKIPKKSVGATITTILASILIKGITTITNISQEPEIIDTINFLNKMGAKIKIKLKNNIIIISGVKNLKGGTYTIIPDRIETGTYLIAAAISKSKIICYNTNPNLITKITEKLIQSGANLKTGNDFISLNMYNNRPKSVNIITSPYPGFPTDMQPQFVLLNSLSKGKSEITENIFENRFQYVKELIYMGAKIKINKNKLICKGVNKLFGKKIQATDLRSTISLILAGCVAQGKTIIKNINHVDRGYEKIEKKLNKIGFNIKRIKNKI